MIAGQFFAIVTVSTDGDIDTDWMSSFSHLIDTETGDFLAEPNDAAETAVGELLDKRLDRIRQILDYLDAIDTYIPIVELVELIRPFFTTNNKEDTP